ncbi:hypothetical protein DH86_00000811 [Scytalidium sp. 3C]|nr:hypothetical protein DH86_00000811 [Scytalidium sp. 3C]
MKLSTAGAGSDKDVVAVPTEDNLPPMDRVQALIDGATSLEAYQGWGATLFTEHVKPIPGTAKPHGSVVFSFTVQPEHTNRLGNLHGGCTATIFDFATTCALAPIARPGFWAYAGVSRTLNVTYLRPVPEGEEVLIECDVVHAGKRLCTLKGVMKRKRDGAVMAICEHGKASIDPDVNSRL